MRTILEVSDRVRIISDCNSRGYKGVIIGKYINGRGCDHVMIKLDNGRKQGYNCLSVEKIESEDFSMAKLTGFKNVAIIEQGTGYSKKDYYYALYDENIMEFDNVLVSGSASGQIWNIKEVISATDERVVNKSITAEVICKIDTSAYDNRCANRKKAEELRKEMDKKRKEIEARKDDEYYASLDPEYAAMLEKMKAMGI